MISPEYNRMSVAAPRTQKSNDRQDDSFEYKVATTPPATVSHIPSSRPVSNSSTQASFVRHSRSRSDPENYIVLTRKYLMSMELESQQVVDVDQRAKIDRIRNIEQEKKHQTRAVGLNSNMNNGHEAQDLIDEISFLEGEIADLERYVLALYRGFFNSRLPGSSPSFHPVLDSPSHTNNERQDRNESFLKRDTFPMRTAKNLADTFVDSFSANPLMQSRNNPKTSNSPVHRKTWHTPKLCETTEVVKNSQILLSQTPMWSKVSQCNHMKYPSLFSEEDGPRLLKDYLSDSLNQLSEDLVLCMANIYCKLRDPAPNSFGVPESPLSCASSSTSLSSIHGMFSDGWSPGSHADSVLDTPLIDPFQVKGKCGGIGSYCGMVEIPSISVDKDKLNHASRMLREYRLMVEKLEKADPSYLSHNEKLAFWINIYNALLMHAYVAYGIPRNNLRRMSILQKASYKVGGYSVNAFTIEHNILRCRSHRPSQWLQNLLSPATKFRSGDGRRMFAIDRPEPLVCFALCCGGRSDPAVKIYTAKNIHEELESSMKDYLQASIGFENNRKVLLPKVVEWYTREASIPSTNIIEWISKNVSENDKEDIQKCVSSRPHRSSSHCIEWVPYNFCFRYIFDRSLTMKFSWLMHQ